MRIHSPTCFAERSTSRFSDGRHRTLMDVVRIFGHGEATGGNLQQWSPRPGRSNRQNPSSLSAARLDVARRRRSPPVLSAGFAAGPRRTRDRRRTGPRLARRPMPPRSLPERARPRRWPCQPERTVREEAASQAAHGKATRSVRWFDSSPEVIRRVVSTYPWDDNRAATHASRSDDENGPSFTFGRRRRCGSSACPPRPVLRPAPRRFTSPAGRPPQPDRALRRR